MSNQATDQAEDVGVSGRQQAINKQTIDKKTTIHNTNNKKAYKILEHDRHGSTEFKGNKDNRLCIGCGTIDKAEFKKQKQVRREKSGPTGLGPDDRRQLRGAGLSRTRSDTTKHGDETSDKSVKPQQKLDAKKDQKHDEKHEHKSANEAIEHRLEGEDLNLDGDDKIVSPKKEITSPDHVLEIDQNTPDNWIPRSEEQVRLTGAHPLNSEQSLKVLEREGLITSNAVHYVRNHGAVPKLDWKTHRVAVSGLVEKPKEFSMEELSKMPAINIPVTISCDGNRRKEVNAIRHSKGFDWGSGGIGTAFWRGVRLCDILKQVGAKSFADGAKYVCFDGADEPKNGTYGTSIPLAVALDPASDIILAYQMNDQQLPPDHGYPVRLVIPGWVGGRMIKWLKSIEVTSDESKSWYHWHDNRVLPSYVGFTKADREDWWKRGDFLLSEQNVNSVIYSPAHGDIIDLHGDTKETITLKGIAYSGGGREVTRVEITLDEGKTWIGAEREFPKHSVRHGYKRWAWCHWKLDIPKWKLLVGDGIAVRAWDQVSNTQPRDITWNLLGMFNNSWYHVKKRLLEGQGKITFDHPTVPGPHQGGWMSTAISPVVKDLKHTPPYRLISPDEVSKHNKPDDPWIIVDGVVYDLTEFTEMHPGGEASIVVNAGKDVTELFNSIHGDDAKRWMQHFSIGFVSELGEGQFLPGLAREERWALQPRKWIDVTLAAREKISPDSYLFKFALKDEKKPLGLPVGQHVLLEAHLGGGHLVIRPYTPVAPIAEDDDSGVIEMVIKIYRSGSNPHFNQGGIMTQYLEQLEIGSTLRVKGPEGHLHYQARGILTVHGHPIRVRRISMIAGGTGITPMYQLIKAILDDPDDTTELALVYSNHTLNDILLKGELDELAQQHHNFKLWYTVSDSPGPEWKFGVGRIDEKMLHEHLFAPGSGSVALVCGPPAMVSLAALPMLEKIGFKDDATFEF